MKRILYLLALLAITASSCQKYDDSALRTDLSGLKDRINALETRVNTLNSDIASMQTIITALQNRDYVVSVLELSDHSGYTIVFSKMGAILVKHGTNGNDGAKGADGANAPVIGVDIFEGVYYWTITTNGAMTWLLDQAGKKLRVTGLDGEKGDQGQNGIAPVIGIDAEGYWTINVGDGTGVKRMKDSQGQEVKAVGIDGDDGQNGADGDSFFSAVTYDADNVYFTFAADDQTITIPRTKSLGITFGGTDEILVSPSKTYTISYFITDADNNTKIEAVAQDGYRVVVTPSDYSSGEITLTTPASLVNSKVLIFVTDGNNKTVMRSINIVEGLIVITDRSYLVGPEGGDVDIEFETNLQYSIDIPSDARTWVHYADTYTKAAMRSESITIRVDPNDNNRYRYVEIKLMNNSIGVSAHILIAQVAKSHNIYVPVAGTLHSLISTKDRLTIENLKITGHLNESDYNFICYAMPLLRSVDLTELSDTTMPSLSAGNGSINIETILLPVGLIEIPSHAFYAHSISKTPSSIPIPESVESIGDNAFEGCVGLTGSLTIPNSVKTIGNYAFYNCIGFTGNLTIPNSVTVIGGGAFLGCSGLTGYLTIPNSISTIKNNAFSDCSGLTGNLAIPSSITTIGNGAFLGCSGFTGDLAIPSSITAIGEGAFSGCSGLTGSLTIPNSVATIGVRAFSGCNGLTGNLVIPNSINTIESYAFSGCSGLTGNLAIPSSVTTIGNGAFLGCSGFTGDLTIPSSITAIGESAFSGCSGLTGNLTIPSSVTSIGRGAFSGARFSKIIIHCSSINASQSPYYNDAPFKGCYGELILGETVISIGEDVFLGCSGLTGSLNIPNSVKTIGNGAFSQCNFTDNLTIGSSVTTIGNYAFYNCSGLTGSLNIPNSVIAIGDGAFSCCGFTDNLTIGSSVNTIGNYAFQNCNGLTGSLTIPSSVATIGYGAFEFCEFNKVYCMSVTPPLMNYNAFYRSSGKVPFLGIPFGSKTSYENAGWGNYFTTIEEVEF